MQEGMHLEYENFKEALAAPPRTYNNTRGKGDGNFNGERGGFNRGKRGRGGYNNNRGGAQTSGDNTFERSDATAKTADKE